MGFESMSMLPLWAALHIDSFTHRLFYTEALHTEPFTQGSLYKEQLAHTHTQKHLHRETFTHRSFDTGQHLQRGLLHTDALTQSSFTHLRQVDRDKLIEMTVMRGRMREDGGRRRRRRRMRIAGMILGKKSTFPGNNLRPGKNIDLLETQFPVPLILWSPGPLVVPWSLVLLIGAGSGAVRDENGWRKVFKGWRVGRHFFNWLARLGSRSVWSHLFITAGERAARLNAWRPLVGTMGSSSYSTTPTETWMRLLYFLCWNIAMVGTWSLTVPSSSWSFTLLILWSPKYTLTNLKWIQKLTLDNMLQITRNAAHNPLRSTDAGSKMVRACKQGIQGQNVLNTMQIG